MPSKVQWLSNRSEERRRRELALTSPGQIKLERGSNKRATGLFVPVIGVCPFFQPAIIDGNEANLVLGVPMMRSDVFVSGLARWPVWTCRSLMNSGKASARSAAALLGRTSVIAATPASDLSAPSQEPGVPGRLHERHSSIPMSVEEPGFRALCPGNER